MCNISYFYVVETMDLLFLHPLVNNLEVMVLQVEALDMEFKLYVLMEMMFLL